MNSLATRIGLSAVILVICSGLSFGALYQQIHSTQVIATRVTHSETVIAITNQIQKTVLDIETGERGYVISGDKVFLQPYAAGRRQLPLELKALQFQEKSDPSNNALVIEIVKEALSYKNGYSVKLVRTAQQNPQAAVAIVKSREGKKRIDSLRLLFGKLLARENSSLINEGNHFKRSNKNTIRFATLSFLFSIILVLLFAGYVWARIVRPLIQMVAVTRRLKDRDFSAKVNEESPAEVGELAGALNSMSRSLARAYQDLENRSAVDQAILNSIEESIWMVNREGEAIFFNKTARKMGELFNMLEGSSLLDLQKMVSQVDNPAALKEALMLSTPDSKEEVSTVITHTISQRSFNCSSGPVRNGEGEIIGRLFVMRDVTALRESERVKDEFIAMVSHELRTPLTSIKGYVEMMLEGDVGRLEPDQERFLQIINRNGERLHRLVGDILLVSQIDAGRMTIRPHEMDLLEASRSAVESALPGAEEKKINLSFSSQEASLPIWGDPERIAQILDNLISNALKFTSSNGKVEVRARREGNKAFLEVEDNGMGVPEKEQERLFERFYRSEKATLDAIPGTGLGLAICQAIAKSHNGSLDLKSKEGLGTTLTLCFPLREESGND
jgi:two-component system phosphate regulon sensor histidine kinase PhoR